MLHCCFDELENFVERATSLAALEEWLYRFGDKERHIVQANATREIIDLYKWWKFTRPQRQDVYDVDDIKLTNWMVKSFDEEDTEMLIRLIKIRHFLWT